MPNFIQNGHIIRVTTLVGGIASATAIIAAYTSAEFDSDELGTTRVYQLPKAATAVMTVGTRVAWDKTAKNITVPAMGASLLRS